MTSTRVFSTRERNEFKLERVISRLANDDFYRRSCFESELLEDVAVREGRDFDPQRPEIPWGLWKRDMTAAGTSGSGYLVDQPVSAAADVLRGFSVVVGAGCTVLPDLVGNTGVPRVTTRQTGYWLGNEATAITEGQPTIGQTALVPKQGGAYVELSRLLALQSQAEGMLEAHLMHVVGRMIDAALLNGSGSSGQPQGIIGTTGVGSATGTSLNAAGLADLEDDCASNDAENLTFITTSAVRKILRGRELATGSGPLWAGSTLLGYPARVSTSMPAGTMIAGDFSRAVLGLWGGITVEVNPFAGFTSGVRALRLLVTLDTGLIQPNVFSVASSIT